MQFNYREITPLVTRYSDFFNIVIIQGQSHLRCLMQNISSILKIIQSDVISSYL